MAWDVGTLPALGFHSPTAINNTIREAHIALDGRHREKYSL